MAKLERIQERVEQWSRQPKFLVIMCVGFFLLTLILAWTFEEILPFSFQTFTTATSVLIFLVLGLSAWVIRPVSTREPLSPVGELNKEISDAKKYRLILLIITISIGGYVGFQAVKVIQIADRGGVESQYIMALRQNLEREEKTFDFLSFSASPVDTEERQSRLNEARVRLDGAEGRYIEELRAAEEARRRVDGRFLFDFFSSFFVRVASVAITLGFFAVALSQFRKIDLRVMELSQLKLAHALAASDTDPTLLQNYRRAVAIIDAPIRTLQDDTEVTIPREIFNNMIGTIDKLGLSSLIRQGKPPET